MFAPGAPGAAGGPTGGVGVPTGANGPLVSIGTLNLPTGADVEKFLADMAAVIKGSSLRVTPPVDNSANPALLPAGAP